MRLTRKITSLAIAASLMVVSACGEVDDPTGTTGSNGGTVTTVDGVSTTTGDDTTSTTGEDTTSTTEDETTTTAAN